MLPPGIPPTRRCLISAFSAAHVCLDPFSADISRLSLRPRASPGRLRDRGSGDGQCWTTKAADGAAERSEGRRRGGQASAAAGHDDRRRAARGVLAVDRLRRPQQHAGHPYLRLDARARLRRGAAAQIRDRPQRSTVPGERPLQVAVIFDRIATSPEAVVSIDGIRESAWATGHVVTDLRDARQSGDGAARARRGHARRDRPRRLRDDHDAQGGGAAPALRGEAARRAAQLLFATTAPFRASCRARSPAATARPRR